MGKNSKLRPKKKKTEYTLKKSVGAGFDFMINYRVKIKRKRMMEKQLLAEEEKEKGKEIQPNKPFAAMLRERKMSLSKTSKTPRRRKKSSQKPDNDIQPISENETKSSPNSSPSKKRKSKIKSKDSKPKKKRKHQR